MTVTDHQPPQERGKGVTWPLHAIGTMMFTGLLAVVAWNVELPYLAFSAGPVSDAGVAINADGIEVYSTNGELLILTVSSQDVNLFDALVALSDPAIDLVAKERVRLPGETDEEYRNRVLQQMDDSTHRAIMVAMTQLGYEMIPIEVVINELVAGTPAAEVLELGDTISAIDGTTVASVLEVRAALEGLAPGDTLEIGIERDGEPMTVVVELAERDDEPGAPMIGVVLGELTEPPFPISIQTGDVGGPSAGMMHTLAIIDILTEGPLTRGHVIAGTGTIQIDGRVGNIGSVRQKVVAAEAAGASHILVPEGNYELALTAERREIEIVAVGTIEDALSFLESLEDA